MQLVSEQELTLRTKEKKSTILNTKLQLKNKTYKNTKLPRTLKYNSFDGGDYQKGCMSNRDIFQ